MHLHVGPCPSYSVLCHVDGSYLKAFARMIEAVGCSNVHLRCNATDLDFVPASAPVAVNLAALPRQMLPGKQ